MTEARPIRHHMHKREPKRHKQDITAIVRELGAEEADDMMQVSPEGAKAALRAAQRRRDNTTGKEQG